MLDKDSTISTILELLKKFLDEEISASDMIRQHDYLMSEEFDYSEEDQRMKLIDEFQEELSLYVEDPKMRQESDQYYDLSMLRVKVLGFLAALQNN